MNADSTYLKSDRLVNQPRQVAVIDIGATSVRMQVAEIQRDGNVRKLESFSQAVSLGKDSFIKGRIEKQTIEDCVHVLGIYRQKLNEYEITSKDQIRVVATSGIKEANNRLAMQDRIYIATGFEIEPFDEAELHRVTFLGVQPFLANHPELFKGGSVTCEVGGGTTELLVMNKSDVIFSTTFRLGSLRLRKTLEAFDLSREKSRQLMESQILQTIERAREEILTAYAECYVAMGSDIRFVAGEIQHARIDDQLVEIDIHELEQFTNDVLSLSPDKIVTRFHFSLPDAESFGPGLLTHLLIAESMNAKKFLVANVNLRDGLLQEMAQGRRWSQSIQEQIVRSAKQLGQKFHYSEKHAVHVAQLSCTLFDQLQPLHHMKERFRGVLELAAILHEVGQFISQRSMHKHSLYLIRNSELFGIGAHDKELVALVARYHRRANPQPSHDGYGQLNREDRVTVAKLAALLRIANALDASSTQRVENLECDIQGDGKQVLLKTSSSADLSMEQLKLKQVTPFFEEIFGADIVLNSTRNA